MGKILSTNLLTYNGYNSSQLFNKILSVPKKVDYKIIQKSFDAERPGDITTRGNRIYEDNMAWDSYIPNLPSSYGNNWTLAGVSEPIIDATTGGMEVRVAYTYQSGPTEFTFKQLTSGTSEITNNIQNYIQSIGGSNTGAPSNYRYIIEGDDGNYYGLILAVFNSDRSNPIVYCFSASASDYSILLGASSGITGWYNLEGLFYGGDTSGIQAATGFNASTIQELGEQIYAILSSS